jgi:hypothetical protein
MAESINRTELAAFRAYVEDHRNDILELVLRGAPSLRHFTLFADVIGKLVLEWADVADIVKPWSKDFSAAADLVSRKPVVIESHFQKAEMQFTPKLDFYTYKARVGQISTKMDAKDYPFARWAMEKMAEKIKTQQEFQQIWTGDQAGSPTTASEIYNGILTIIADDQASGTPVLTPIATGALTDASIIDQVEQMDDAINEEYRTEMMKIFCAPHNFRKYRRAYREASGFHPGNPDTDAMDEITLDGSTTKLVSCPGMGTSNRLVLTPSRNIYYAYDDPTDDSVFEMEQDHRNLDVWCDFWGGTGFLILDPRIVYINDQA